MRELATAEAGSAEFSPAALQRSVLAAPPSSLARRLSDSVGDRPSRRAAPAAEMPEAMPSGSGKRLVLTVVGPDRLGIVHDVARAVFGKGGSVAASRMAKLDDFFAVVMQLVVPEAAVADLEAELGAALPGLQVSLRTAREGQFRQPPHEAEVRCVCPEDAPGLLMRFTSALVEAGLNVLLLDTEVKRLASSQGFLMRAKVGSEVPVDASLLQSRLDASSLGVAARISVAVLPAT